VYCGELKQRLEMWRGVTFDQFSSLTFRMYREIFLGRNRRKPFWRRSILIVKRECPPFRNHLPHSRLQIFDPSIRNIRRFVLTLFPVIFYKSQTLPWATEPGG
jgi:hypothetical protein